MNWIKNCVMSDNNDYTTFKIARSIVILSTEDNVKLTKQLNEGFKRPDCWNQYRMNIL